MTPVRVPTKATLRRYGLSLAEWQAILEAQGWVCAVCERVPQSGRLCVDHYHRRGWKVSPPDVRKRDVRGVLCSYCNLRLVAKGMTLSKARNIVRYLEAFQRKVGSIA